MDERTGPPDLTLERDYFEFVYGANDDPWHFETSAYEAAKYEATIAALPNERYRSALEIGCSLGVLTYRLAGKCDQLLAVDLVSSVLERAAERCRGFSHVTFREAVFPDEFPNESFDLVVVSEVGYYWSTADLDRSIDHIAARLIPGGHVILVHWTAPVHDYPQTGDQVHERFLARGEFASVRSDRDPSYRLDVLQRRDATGQA